MGAAPAAESGGAAGVVGAGRRGNDMEEEEDGLRVMGDSKWWPPGFRFHPTDEELVLYYLKRKVCRRQIKLAVVADLDVYKWEPWELPEKSALRTGDKQWYFFSPRDRKYPNGSRSNRATQHGYWKATGKDRTISHNSSAVGNKKTLVYYNGRAPKGQRTDWVMHEYTLDEQMLTTFNNVQDYYALYKVFRKSGPGPKNGEEYGAPFREEEWDDDAADDGLRNQINREDPIAELPFGDSVARVIGDEDRIALPNYDLEDLLLQMPSDPETIQQHSKHPAFVPEVNIESEIGSDILVPTSYVDVDFAKRAWSKKDSVQTSFQLSPSASAAYMQPMEMPEVTSLTSFSEQGQLTADEEFLEIKDFNDPDSAIWCLDDISNNGLIPGTNEFYDPYEYFDAQMYLAEALGPNNGTSPNLFLNGFADEETYSQESHITTELWTREQASNASTAEESNQVMKTYTASSGEVHASGRLSDLGGGDGEGPINTVASPSDSWFSSALSAFLDSVPSSPAIASENALLNRALERVSSFRAGKIRGGGDPRAATGDGAAVGRRQVSHNGGFLFISFLGVVVAILWALSIGATVKVIKGFWGKFTSS